MTPGSTSDVEVALGDAALDDLPDEPVDAAPLRHHDRLALGAEAAQVALGDGRVAGVGAQDAGPAGDEGAEAGRRVGGVERGTLLDHRDAPAVVAVDDGEEQIFLAVDVVVEAPLEEPDPGRDVLDPGGGVALLVEHLARGIDDLVPPLGVQGPPGPVALAASVGGFSGASATLCSASSVRAGNGLTLQVGSVGQPRAGDP